MTLRRPWGAPLLLLLWSSGALAAKNATIQGKNVILRGQPDAGSQSLGTLSDGEPVQTSNYPTQGFYKVRTSTGEIGWVNQSAVGLEALPGAPDSSDLDLPPPKEENAASPSAPTSSVPHVDVKSTGPNHAPSDEIEQQPTSQRTPLEIKAYGGLSWPTLSGVNGVLGGSLLSTMPYFGGQIGYPLQDNLYLVFRADHLLASPSNSGADFELSSTPLMLGMEYTALRRDQFFIQGSLLLGVALATTLDMTVPTQPQPNLTELSSTSFTEMIQIDAGIDLSRRVAIFAETGYRFLKGESVGPSIVGNGGSVFQNTDVPIDLSGPFVGGGLLLRL